VPDFLRRQPEIEHNRPLALTLVARPDFWHHRDAARRTADHLVWQTRDPHLDGVQILVD